MLTHGPSHLPPPEAIEPEESLRHTEAFWTEWVDAKRLPDGESADAVIRSLITLKALTYAPTGGIVAAPTTSLPEQMAASATGTTGSAGCGTPPTRCWRS